MNRLHFVTPIIVAVLSTQVARAQTPGQPPLNRPSFGVGSVNMVPTGDGFYNATVVVNPQSFQGSASVPFVVVNVQRVKTPDEAKQHLHEELERLADQVKSAADQVNVPMR